MHCTKLLLSGAVVLLGAMGTVWTESVVAAEAAPIMMSARWATRACEAWNKDAVLTDELGSSGWIENDNGRGYKVLQVVRTDCEGSTPAELRISPDDGKAICVYGGKLETTELDSGADYNMTAQTGHWTEMGKGEYGPIYAMFFNKLTFSGPMFEAMGNMGPFENFLLLVGKVHADTASCPK
jgi:putative sterol carrier protein